MKKKKKTEWVFGFVLVEGLRGKRLNYIYIFVSNAPGSVS